MAKKNKLGIEFKKSENFSDWYVDVIQKAELIEYTDVSGCLILRPRAFAIWEKTKLFLDNKFKKSGVKNAAFPLFIPEKNLTKEAEHVQGFAPEVAWVTHAGENKLNERLAIRPTSETIMYPAYSKWIRSYKDLPLRLNQWCSVVRWEFSHPVPFLRTREFWWQEGHTVFETKAEANLEVMEILNYYKEAFEDLMAVPVWGGFKSAKEKFAGADYTLSLESFLPNGKAIQACTSHMLGQNFAKAFNIKFTGKDEKEHVPWQNSWGFTTRAIGIMIMLHSDDKGLVIPPKIADEKVVIVPIIFQDSKDKVMKKANEIKQILLKYNVILDAREDYSPGWKFNEWELKGIPLRLELGPKDLLAGHIMLVRRDTGEKTAVKFEDIKSTVKTELALMQKRLLKTAKLRIKQSTVKVKSWRKFKEALENKQLILAPWCDQESCEAKIKEESGGAKTLNLPFKQAKLLPGTKCFKCRQPAKLWAYLAKSY